MILGHHALDLQQVLQLKHEPERIPKNLKRTNENGISMDTLCFLWQTLLTHIVHCVPVIISAVSAVSSVVSRGDSFALFPALNSVRLAPREVTKTTTSAVYLRSVLPRSYMGYSIDSKQHRNVNCIRCISYDMYSIPYCVVVIYI